MGLSHTVSGNIASFRTPSRVPIESLKFHFLPKQAAGTPSPENPIPIEGWTELNGRRAGKNIGHIIGYSAINNAINSSRKLTNNYGTTISTTEFTQPDTELIITQSSYDTSVSKSHYNNGYFSFHNDNLSFNKYYDVSMKISNIISNPLNANLVDLVLYGPNSVMTVSEIVNNNTIVFKNIFYPEHGTIDRHLFELRICGMSFTVSEIMVTPANKSDGVFEPYSGEQIPITFPITGTNKVDPSTITPETRISVSDGIYSNTGTDTRTFTQLQVQLWKTTGTYIKTAATLNNVTTTGRKALTFDVDTEDCHYIAFKHNGIVADFRVIMPFNLGLGTYTLSVDLLSADPTTVSGFRFKDVQLEVGDTAHAYEPYSSDNTFYGGYYDPVAGEIVATFKKINLKNKAWYYYTSNQFALNTDKKLLSDKVFCDMLPISKINGYPTDDKSIGFWGNGASYAYIIFIKYEASNDVNDFKAWLNSLDNDPCLVYEFATPIHIPVPAEDMKAFLDHNNFWSDANDITEVTYAVTESKDILATRKKAMEFDMGHHRKVKWNQWAPAVSGNNYAPYNANNVSCSIENGIITQTFLKKGSSYSFAITTPNNVKKHVLNRYYYISYEFCTDFAGSIGGTVGGQFAWESVKATTPNVWGRCSGVVKRTEGGNFDNYVAYVGWFDTSTGIEIGSTCQIRNPIAIDLTQMFGEGNEPTTAAKFERICELNGIDLTTYYSRDQGSDRWLIIP